MPSTQLPFGYCSNQISSHLIISLIHPSILRFQYCLSKEICMLLQCEIIFCLKNFFKLKEFQRILSSLMKIFFYRLSILLDFLSDKFLNFIILQDSIFLPPNCEIMKTMPKFMNFCILSRYSRQSIKVKDSSHRIKVRIINQIFIRYLFSNQVKELWRHDLFTQIIIINRFFV